MGCSSGSCSSGGCTSCGGGCETGGCNKVNTYDWLTIADIADPRGYQYVEVSFKNGSRKDFYKVKPESQYTTGDWVAVDTDGGYDVGQITLSGELVALQIKKKKVRESNINNEVLRLANERDMERFREARSIERDAMIRARAAAYSLNLNMKIGDVEYQCDMRKATFYFTSDSRVDFRELIRIYAKEFRVKIEMRQIGMRQESAKIGGLGTCGRELCCSTWLTSFKSVNTSAARYQNLSINQTKLSGQCGRLKCCLNFELDTYLDALDSFPENADTLKLKNGKAQLIKMDIFKGIMYYSYHEEMRNVIVALDKDVVADLKADIAKGIFPESLQEHKYSEELENEEEEWDYDDDGTGEIELPAEKRKRKKKKKKPAGNNQSVREENSSGQESSEIKQGQRNQKSFSNTPRQDNSSQGTENKKESTQEPGVNQQGNKKQFRNRGRNKPGSDAPQQDAGKNDQVAGVSNNQQQEQQRPAHNTGQNAAANSGEGAANNNKQKNRNRRFKQKQKNNPNNSNSSNNNTNNQNS